MGCYYSIEASWSIRMPAYFLKEMLKFSTAFHMRSNLPIKWHKAQRHHSVSRIYCMTEKAPFWITNICAEVSQHNLGCNYYTIALIALLWQICAKICIPKEASTTFSKNAFYIRLVKFVANQNIFFRCLKKGLPFTH